MAELKYNINGTDVKFENLEAVMTPFGEAEWAHLVTPDTKFNPEGDYKVNLILEGDEATAFKEQIEAVRTEALGIYTEAAKNGTKPGRKPKAVKASDIMPFEEMEDGKIAFKLKRKASYIKETGEKVEFEVTLVDAKGKKIKDTENLNIGNGSVIRGRVQLLPYNMATSGVGVSLRLMDVQIKKLVEYSATSAYDAVDEGDDAYVVDDGVEDAYSA